MSSPFTPRTTVPSAGWRVRADAFARPPRREGTPGIYAPTGKSTGEPGYGPRRAPSGGCRRPIFSCAQTTSAGPSSSGTRGCPVSTAFPFCSWIFRSGIPRRCPRRGSMSAVSSGGSPGNFPALREGSGAKNDSGNRLPCPGKHPPSGRNASMQTRRGRRHSPPWTSSS